jgi:hypothetical protein
MYDVNYRIIRGDIEVDSGSFLLDGHFTDPYEIVCDEYCKKLQKEGEFEEGMELKVFINSKPRSFKMISETVTVVKYKYERLNPCDEELEVISKEILNSYIGIKDVEFKESKLVVILDATKDIGYKRDLMKDLESDFPEIDFLFW